ncbi:MAG: gamma carbonic anhydrase family protein [Chlorobi bacterium]|nr:gamma carbonic anhydrase family protein [Chlorobiota bacterium]
MALIWEVRGKKPWLSEGVFLAPSATIIGDVVLGKGSSVWFNAVVRGDVNEVRIGEATNIQDNVTIHCTYQKYGTYIGDYVTIGHNSVIHGCTIEDLVLIGMGALIMDGAVVESGVIVGAGSVVTPGTRLKSGYVYGGIPAKPLKEIDIEEVKKQLREQAERYVMYSQWYKEL